MFRLRITGDLGFEAWLNIPGYEGLYEASTHGRIRSTKRNTTNGKILTLVERPDKYLVTNLSKEGKEKTARVARLICETFIPNPNAYPCVNHKDENRKNNNVGNLEWCSYEYNNNYGLHKQRATESRSKKVVQYDINGGFISEYPSINEASRKTGIALSCIGRCCSGEFKQTHGYIFKCF